MCGREEGGKGAKGGRGGKGEGGAFFKFAFTVKEPMLLL